MIPVGLVLLGVESEREVDSVILLDDLFDCGSVVTGAARFIWSLRLVVFIIGSEVGSTYQE